ncbi:hypothetical protein PR003_g30836 [Phytophthora rubi]|uniref:Uncharacterized protein n=1 Tax=Phytophthora rubi TaxID=129364 RepID=A0A6A4BBG7_9STRA|nr:hypothetical protein PR003_g30836 [Phytophthora rubi]
MSPEQSGGTRRDENLHRLPRETEVTIQLLLPGASFQQVDVRVQAGREVGHRLHRHSARGEHRSELKIKW